MTDNDYDAGLRDGRLNHLETSLIEHKKQTERTLYEHEVILKRQERVLWMIIGAVGFINFLPEIKSIL